MGMVGYDQAEHQLCQRWRMSSPSSPIPLF